MYVRHVSIAFSIWIMFAVSSPVISRASTAAFAGKVIDVQTSPPDQNDHLLKFTVGIDYFDYCSWGKFGKDSKVGIPITRQVKALGTVCILNGQLTNAATFAAAMKPGHWGYFYEDTWLDLQTLPDFQWGEVIKHDAASKQFTMRVHATHKAFHLAANPPKNVVVKYGAETAFRIENEDSDAISAIKRGHWVQIHEPRAQIVHVGDPSAKYHTKEWLPQADGKRGFANDLTAPVILKGYKTKTPDGVIDQAVELDVARKIKDKWKNDKLNCRSTTFVLDGKVAPVNIGAKAGRHAVLGYYRKEKTPHKIFVRSQDDAMRGWITEARYDSPTRLFGLTLQSRAKQPVKFKVTFLHGTIFQRNGIVTTPGKALQPGFDVVYFPARGRVIIAFVPK